MPSQWGNVLRVIPPGVRLALVLLGVAPFLPRLLAGIPLLEWVGDGCDAWFAFQCHRESGRSPQLFGAVMPVCARCFGIYFGLGLGALILRPRLTAWPLRIWVALAGLLMVGDVVTEHLGLRPAWSTVRLLSGVLLSYPVGSALVWSARATWGADRA
jgi:uncharacterized membrane protein